MAHLGPRLGDTLCPYHFKVWECPCTGLCLLHLLTGPLSCGLGESWGTPIPALGLDLHYQDFRALDSSSPSSLSWA